MKSKFRDLLLKAKNKSPIQHWIDRSELLQFQNSHPYQFVFYYLPEYLWEQKKQQVNENVQKLPVEESPSDSVGSRIKKKVKRKNYIDSELPSEAEFEKRVLELALTLHQNPQFKDFFDSTLFSLSPGVLSQFKKFNNLVNINAYGFIRGKVKFADIYKLSPLKFDFDFDHFEEYIKVIKPGHDDHYVAFGLELARLSARLSKDKESTKSRYQKLCNLVLTGGTRMAHGADIQQKKLTQYSKYLEFLKDTHDHGAARKELSLSTERNIQKTEELYLKSEEARTRKGDKRYKKNGQHDKDFYRFDRFNEVCEREFKDHSFSRFDYTEYLINRINQESEKYDI